MGFLNTSPNAFIATSGFVPISKNDVVVGTNISTFKFYPLRGGKYNVL